MNNPNSPVFPILDESTTHPNKDGGFTTGHTYSGGLTKREYVATAVLQGLLAHGKPVVVNDQELSYNKASVIIADALLAELEKQK